MPEIYLLRHAAADISQGLPDGERPLSEEGRAEAQKLALDLEKRKVRFDLILTSPYLRAKETAEIISKTLDCARMDVSGSLSSGRDPWLALKDPRCHSLKSVLLVGHAPDLGRLLGELTGGGEVPLAPGALACVEVASIPPTALGKLLWIHRGAGAWRGFSGL